MGMQHSTTKIVGSASVIGAGTAVLPHTNSDLYLQIMVTATIATASLATTSFLLKLAITRYLASKS